MRDTNNGTTPGFATPNEKAPGAANSKGLKTDTNSADYANHGPGNHAHGGAAADSMNNFSSLAHSGARIRVGAKNTQSEASKLYVNELFSCPEFMVLVVGRAYPQGWPQRFGVVLKPHVHSFDLRSQRMVFEFPEGIKIMTTTPPRATAHTTTPGTPAPYQSPVITPVRLAVPIDAHTAIARHQHIQNAISTASWHLRHGRVNEATGRILSAARQLKNLCAETAGA